MSLGIGHGQMHFGGYVNSSGIGGQADLLQQINKSVGLFAQGRAGTQYNGIFNYEALGGIRIQW